MSMLSGGGADPPTKDDLRQLESRIDARLQEVNARLVLNDGRFAAITDRVNQADRRADALSARVDARLRTIDQRFDAIDQRLDTYDARMADTRDRLLDEIRVTRSHHSRTTLLGFAGSTAVMATLCLGTVVVAI
ncbi:MAG TPA: hypothetical protein VIL36_10435 [Acidimicrobiales bacterium]